MTKYDELVKVLQACGVDFEQFYDPTFDHKCIKFTAGMGNIVGYDGFYAQLIFTHDGCDFVEMEIYE